MYWFVAYLTMQPVAQALYIAMPRWLINAQLEWIWKEVVISWFDILASYIPGQTEENHDSLSLASL